MRIPCPYCGERGSAEFTYLGDAAPVRPRDGRARGDVASAEAFHDYVYLRANSPGTMREWWQHTGGCRAWLAVERDVTSHTIGQVSGARDAQVSAARDAKEMGR